MRQPNFRIYCCYTLLITLALAGQLRAQLPRPGKDHALFFAVNTYKPPLTSLKNPITNAREIAAELKNRYGFTVEIFPDFTAAQIEQKIKDYTNRYARNQDGQYPTNGRLLVFFSGHGTEELDNGFFLPTDGDADNLRATGFEYSLLRSRIDAINCQHILVAVDACYSVHFDEKYKSRPDFKYSRPGELDENAKILVNHEKYRSRVFYTSDAKGSITPDQSSFAKKLLEGLRTFNPISGFMTSSELFANFVQKASPTPHGGEFGKDEAGSTFLFFSSTPRPAFDPNADVNAWNAAKASNSSEAYQGYLRNFPQGEFRELAAERLQKLENKVNDYDAWQKAKQAKTREGYEKYLQEYPNGSYRELAETALNGLAPEIPDNMVYIPGGTFQMGSTEGGDDEKPVHSVTVSSFYLSKYEVTVADFKKFMDEYTAYQTDADKDGGSYAWDGKAWTKKAGVNWKCDPEGNIRPLSEYNHPVVHVSWNDAVKYAAWLSQKTGRSYRLPTEAEWEYAAGNGSKHNKYSWGNGDPSGKQGGNVGDETGARKFNWTKSAENIFVGYNDGFATTAPVGSFYANELGLYDMSGNVWEWCQDWYASDYYAKSPTVNPKGADNSSDRVFRGGSWLNAPAYVRVADRRGYAPGLRGDDIGFRLARQQ